MKLIDLVFELVWKFVPIKQEDFAQMRKEAEDDMKNWTEDDKNPLIRLHQKYANKWAFKLGTAIMWIPLVRWISDWQEGRNRDEEEVVRYED